MGCPSQAASCPLNQKPCPDILEVRQFEAATCDESQNPSGSGARSRGAASGLSDRASAHRSAKDVNDVAAPGQRPLVFNLSLIHI